jgi:hypothetical protein
VGTVTIYFLYKLSEYIWVYYTTLSFLKHLSSIPPTSGKFSMVLNPSSKTIGIKNVRQCMLAVAVLAGTLPIANPAHAVNLTIGNSVNDSFGATNTNEGQSFINDPSGSGATVNLNTWTFAFADPQSAINTSSLTLGIYAGTGNGGTLIGTAAAPNTTTTVFGFDAVQWVFAGGGLSLIETDTYTAVMQGTTSDTRGSNSNPYPNGEFTVGSNGSTFADNVFQATFSTAAPATSVPEPFTIIGTLTGGIAAIKMRKKLKAAVK